MLTSLPSAFERQIPYFVDAKGSLFRVVGKSWWKKHAWCLLQTVNSQVKSNAQSTAKVRSGQVRSRRNKSQQITSQNPIHCSLYTSFHDWRRFEDNEVDWDAMIKIKQSESMAVGEALKAIFRANPGWRKERDGSYTFNQTVRSSLLGRGHVRSSSTKLCSESPTNILQTLFIIYFSGSSLAFGDRLSDSCFPTFRRFRSSFSRRPRLIKGCCISQLSRCSQSQKSSAHKKIKKRTKPKQPSSARSLQQAWHPEDGCAKPQGPVTFRDTDMYKDTAYLQSIPGTDCTGWWKHFICSQSGYCEFGRISGCNLFCQCVCRATLSPIGAHLRNVLPTYNPSQTKKSTPSLVKGQVQG